MQATQQYSSLRSRRPLNKAHGRSIANGAGIGPANLPQKKRHGLPRLEDTSVAMLKAIRHRLTIPAGDGEPLG
jgi:hypothetical protein